MKTRKIISALIAFVMLLSVCVMAISADMLLIAPAPTTEMKKSIFKQADTTTKNEDAAVSDKVEDKTENKVEDKTEVKPTDKVEKEENKYDFYKPTTDLPGTVRGTYYTVADAKVELEKYFDENTYSLDMILTESREFAENCYFYSATPSVVSYNYKTGALTAKSLGTADVYVFSRGGVPLLRLRITVRSHFSYDKEDMSDKLTVSAAEWNIPEWKFSSLSTVSDSGKIYSDIAYKPVFGGEHISVDAEDAVFMTYNEGVSVVRAYSESDTSVYGDTIIYSGKYNSAIRLGKWFVKDGTFYVKEWCYDIASPYLSVTGWVKTEGGMLIPVVSWKSFVHPWEFMFANNLIDSVLRDIIKK